MTQPSIKTVITAAAIAFAAPVGAQACGGPGADYAGMTPVSAATATHEVIPETGTTRSLAAPGSEAAAPSPGKAKVMRVGGVPGSFEITKSYGLGERCPGTPTSDVAFKISAIDLGAAFDAGADIVVIDFGGGAKGKCPALPIGRPNFTPARAVKGVSVVTNNGARDNSYLRHDDAVKIKAAGCVAMHLLKSGM